MSKSKPSIKLRHPNRSPSQRALYRGRRISAANLALFGTLLATSPVAQEAGKWALAPIVRTIDGLNAAPKFNDTEKYVVKPGDTEWTVASAEGPAVKNSAQAMYNAMNDITRQLPVDQQATQTLVPGEVIMLPKGSQNNGPDQLASSK